MKCKIKIISYERTNVKWYLNFTLGILKRFDHFYSNEQKIKIEIDNEQKFLEFHSGRVRVCLHGGGGPQVGEVTRQSGVTCLSI